MELNTERSVLKRSTLFSMMVRDCEERTRYEEDTCKEIDGSGKKEEKNSYSILDG